MINIIAVGVFFAAFFWFFPGVDIAFSNFFYDLNKGFIYADHPVTNGIYQGVEIFTKTIVLLLIVNLIGKFLQNNTNIVCDTKKVLPYKYTVYLLLVLALGPGLLVHNVLKEYYERPRPKHIIEFGGKEIYAAPFEKRDNSPGKSFVSGHAAIGFYIVSFALLLKGRKRTLTYSGGIIAGLVVGIARIAQGKHFLSDIIFSGIFTLMVAYLIFWIMFRKKPDPKHPE